MEGGHGEVGVACDVWSAGTVSGNCRMQNASSCRDGWCAQGRADGCRKEMWEYEGLLSGLHGVPHSGGDASGVAEVDDGSGLLR